MSSYTHIPTGVRWLAVSTVAVIYILIVLGAVVRATGSGLGCPDWPLCYGQIVPPGHAPGTIEYSHRLLGGVAGVMIVATLVAWVQLSGRRPRVVAGALGILLLLGVQVGLGAAVVNLELPPLLVMVHLGMAMALFALLIALAAGRLTNVAAPSVREPDQRWMRSVVGAVIAVYVLVLLGAYVRASGASWACAGFPGCNEAWLPFGNNRLVDIHLAHRLLAYAVGAHILVLAVRANRGRSRVGRATQRAALWCAGTVVAQIGVGAVAVSTGVPPLAQVLHVAGAAAVWGTTVWLLTVAVRERTFGAPEPNAGRRRGGAGQRGVEGSMTISPAKRP